MNQNKLRFAIIGCGKIAQRHAEHISKRGVLVAVCDIVKEKADSIADQYGARAYYEVADVLKNKTDIDIAVICTPNGLHAAQSIVCLDAGMHVLCEKPMALNVEDCQLMIEAANRSNKILAIVKQNRFNPPVVAVKELLDKGVLGKVFSIHVNCYWNREAAYYAESNWRGTKKLDGGILFTQFSHFIDILYWFAGEVEAANSYLANYNHKGCIEFEDCGTAILRFKNGVTGNINFTINSFAKNIEGSVTIIAERGSVKIGGAYLNTIEFQNIDGYIVEEINEMVKANDYGNYQGSMSNHNKVYDNLIEVLENGASLSASSFEGLKTVEIIEKIYNAAIWSDETLKPGSEFGKAGHETMDLINSER